MHKRQALRRFIPALLLAGLFVAISTLTRALLALRPEVSIAGGAADWLRIFGYGLAFDAIAASYVLAPVALWLALAGFAAMSFAFVLLAIAEWLFWDEFGSRFNFIAVDYLL